MLINFRKRLQWKNAQKKNNTQVCSVDLLSRLFPFSYSRLEIASISIDIQGKHMKGYNGSIVSPRSASGPPGNH